MSNGPVRAIIAREIRLAWSGGGLWLPILFFLAVAVLFPFAVGPDPKLLVRTGGGIIWIAALLASLLPIDRLLAEDRSMGVIDQFSVRGLAEEYFAAAKIAGHWLGFAPPLFLATVVASALMGLPQDRLAVLLLGLVIATPALAALAVLAASLTMGIKGGAALSGLIVLPLAIPVLIFGAGALGDNAGGALKFLAALSLMLTALCPFAAGAAIRAGRE